MKKIPTIIPIVFALFFFSSCQKNVYYEDLPDGAESINQLRNDLSFVIGTWELVRLSPNYNSESWISFAEDGTFTSYFVYPNKPYFNSPHGAYKYSDGVISCVDADTNIERKLIFTQIVGRNSYNKIEYIYPDETGNSMTMYFELCRKK